MLPWLSAADPGRVHTEGRMARVTLEEAREQVAALFGTRPRQVVFTSGATEAINAAVYGALRLARDRGPHDGRGDVALAAVEHSAVREASEREVRDCRGEAATDPTGAVAAAAPGAHPGPGPGEGPVGVVAAPPRKTQPGPGPGGDAAGLVALEVDRTGRIHPESVAEALSAHDHLALVHCQWANHEVGTIQPIDEIVRMCREREVLVHVDAAAAAGHVPIDFDALGADLMSVSAHKFGGPRGIGALLVRRGLRVPPLLLGGAQERARRAGLENVAAAVGFGATAAELLDDERLKTEARMAAVRAERLRTCALAVAGIEVYGPDNPGARLPSLVCLGIAGVEAEAVLVGLDQAGVAAHSGSACSSELLEPSPVLAAMGVNAERSLRLSVGWSTTDAEVELAARALPAVVEGLRALGGM
jgi:cysteine desulfurase